MKMKLKKIRETKVDLKSLKKWKNLSTKAKLDWLDSALKFGKLKSF